MTSIIAIVGRPNVGKSTLYNRLLKSRDSLVDDHPGITRDRLYGPVDWDHRPLTIIDTGGFEDLGQEPLIERVKAQTLKAVDEADSILFMVDGRQGIMPGDEELADILRRARKKVFLAVNKIDGPEHDGLIADFFPMGFDHIFPISAAHGYGIKAFMDEVVKGLPEGVREQENMEQIRVAVVGRPNVGKSSLINRILGIDRLLVSDLPGTTRDSVDTLFHWKGKEFLLIDTAGVRRKTHVKEKIQKFSMIKTLRSLSRCHIAVILLDAAAGIVEQDVRILGYALEHGRGVVLAVNKWDLLRKDTVKKRQIDNAIKRQFQFVSYAPRIHLSALTGERVKPLLDKIDQLYSQFNQEISTGTLNRALQEILAKKPPPRAGRGHLRFYYATQTGVRPPTFVVFTNHPDSIHFTYQRFLVNQFKESLGLSLTPIRLVFRKK